MGTLGGENEGQYKKIISGVALALVLLVLFIGYIVTAKGSVQESIWALVPPVVAIALALITKEVYSSLLFGIVTGALLFFRLSTGEDDAAYLYGRHLCRAFPPREYRDSLLSGHLRYDGTASE